MSYENYYNFYIIIFYTPRKRTSIVEIEHLIRIQKFSKAGDQLKPLATARFHVHEDE